MDRHGSRRSRQRVVKGAGGRRSGLSEPCGEEEIEEERQEGAEEEERWVERRGEAGRPCPDRYHRGRPCCFSNGHGLAIEITLHKVNANQCERPAAEAAAEDLQPGRAGADQSELGSLCWAPANG